MTTAGPSNPRRSEARLTAITAAVIVGGTALGLGATALFTSSQTVEFAHEHDGDSVIRSTHCGPTLDPAAVPGEALVNHATRDVRVISVSSRGSYPRVSVRDFVVVDQGRDGRSNEVALSVGFLTLPKVAHPRTILAGHTATLEVLTQPTRVPQRADGFDILVDDGHETRVLHDTSGVEYAEQCP